MNAAFEDCLVFAELLESCEAQGQEGQAGPVEGGAAGARRAALQRAIEAMTEKRQPAADGLSQLAMMNYRDMAHNTTQRLYLLRKQVEAAMHRLFPSSWLPLYTMVTFTRIPYNEVLERHDMQERILSRLLVAGGLSLVLSGAAGAAGVWRWWSRR